MRARAPQTWHYGLVAEWWAEFNVDGPEIDYFRRWIEENQPALDAGCGTGRLLLPWLRAGLDVDGSDLSADMIERCRTRARAEGYDPTLIVQPLHELELPRRYRTIVACGVFGIGSTRAQDEEALRRFHRWLEPGGTLLLDKEVPYANAPPLAAMDDGGAGTPAGAVAVRIAAPDGRRRGTRAARARARGRPARPDHHVRAAG